MARERGARGCDPLAGSSRGAPGDPKVIIGRNSHQKLRVIPPGPKRCDGLEGFSHIWIVWWLDGFDEPPTSQFVHPEGRTEIPQVGLFATRSPHRPNPIAMTAVRLLEHREDRLRVEGLDAYEGSPILDIKPYLRRGDQIPEAEMPDWLEHLWRIHDEERDV